VRLLPLFPLPLVLFPGAPLPLHIFEPRYRRLLADAMHGTREFGIIFKPEDTTEDAIESGSVGCVARIAQSEMLPDGRSNIIVHGLQRFTFHRFVVSDAPYWVGEVSEYEDRAEGAAPLEEDVERVCALFRRVGSAARVIADDTDPLPELPADPALVSFAIAGYVDLDPAHRQRLLASRSPRERLTEVESLLERALQPIEAHAAAHRRASSNGHGPTLGESA
jgi:Lon protease-like protein